MTAAKIAENMKESCRLWAKSTWTALNSISSQV